MFSCGFYEISKNTFSYRRPPVAASDILAFVNIYLKADSRLLKKIYVICVSFLINLQTEPEACNFIKKETLAQVGIFLWILRNLQEHLFLQNTSGGYFWYSHVCQHLFKGGLSPSKKNCVICLIGSPLKVIKNASYFILKALFVLKIFKF